MLGATTAAGAANPLAHTHFVDVRRVLLGVLCVLSVLIGSADVAAATMVRHGGVAFGARVIEQTDGATYRLELSGPAKDGALRGVITARADRATRFNLSAGVMGRTVYGSLGALRIGPTLTVDVVLGRLLPDGSYRLLALTTVTR